MTRKRIHTNLLGLGLALFASATASAHPAHSPESSSSPEQPSKMFIALQDGADSPAVDRSRTTGQGDLQFKVLKTSAALPKLALNGLNEAHGGFAVDRREGKGEIYFALPNVGIIRVSSDFETIDILVTDAAMVPKTMHNTTIWHTKKRGTYLSFPGVDAGAIFTTTIHGELVNTLSAPTKETEFDNQTVAEYFGDGRLFIPTDVEILNKKFYITTGYSPLDYVLTADIKTRRGISSEWEPFAFGGKGDEPGQFRTGHGITIAPDGETITVADRPNSEIESFDKKGTYLGKLDLPEGSFPCDIDYESGYTVVGCLHGPEDVRADGAPIYIVKDGEVQSTIMIKKELGLEKFQHIHNAVMVNRNGKFYIIAQAWNPGDFAILEQVK
jgi:hypothetical protein